MMRGALARLSISLAGVGLLVAAVVWEGVHEAFVRRAAPPGWILDVAAPAGPRYLAVFGVLLIFVAIVSAIAVWAKRTLSR